MTQLVLSLFPGVDLLGLAFKREGFSVVQGGDVIFGGDIRDEHYPPGKFSGIIGGPPCQAFSALVHMVRHNGYEPKFGNLIPEFERCVLEAEPDWFVMENVPKAPLPFVAGYALWSTLLNNRQCFDDDGKPAVQNRVRRWTFGVRGSNPMPLLIDTVALEAIEFAYAACGGSTSRSLSWSGWDGGAERRITKKGRLPINAKSRRSFRDLCELQGLPGDFDIPAFTVAAKCKAVGNGVPLPMGRAIARAVREATELAARGGEQAVESEKLDLRSEKA